MSVATMATTDVDGVSSIQSVDFGREDDSSGRFNLQRFTLEEENKKRRQSKWSVLMVGGCMVVIIILMAAWIGIGVSERSQENQFATKESLEGLGEKLRDEINAMKQKISIELEKTMKEKENQHDKKFKNEMSLWKSQFEKDISRNERDLAALESKVDQIIWKVLPNDESKLESKMNALGM